MQPATLYYREREKVCVCAGLPRSLTPYLHSPGLKHRPSTFKSICDFLETGGNGHISLHRDSAWKMAELPDKLVKMGKHLSFRLSTL